MGEHVRANPTSATYGGSWELQRFEKFLWVESGLEIANSFPNEPVLYSTGT